MPSVMRSPLNHNMQQTDGNGYTDADSEMEESQYTDDESVTDQENEDENIAWTGYKAQTPVILFRPDAMSRKIPELRTIGEKFHLTFKIVKTECKLVRSILTGHGFHEAHPNSSDFNLMWTGSHVKPFVLRSLTEFQKINHFPRSYEITRKDRLFKNVQKMQQTKGFKHFDFVPSSFILPAEYQDFCTAFLRERGAWIVKPIASSRGRGIFLINHPDQAPLDEQMIVCKYIANPFLIDGYKFDIRLYVAVTSYDPLIVYIYEEGLTRFATIKFDKAARFIRNQCMHLTNYSVNKKNEDFVHNDNADVEDFGNKWSLGALLRFLRSEGKDVSAMMCRIEDVIVKTLLSVEGQVGTACKMFMPFRGNCFELYGFDILLDEELRPWVLEVNLSPSLACDAPLDLKIKANMISDLFSLVGLVCQDPMTKRLTQQSRRNLQTASQTASRSLRLRPGSSPSTNSRPLRPSSAGSINSVPGSSKSSFSGLTGEEIRIVRRAKEEVERAGGWVRIFPTHDTWDLYSHFFTSSSTHNSMLSRRLFSDDPSLLKPNTLGISTRLPRSIQLHSSNNPAAVLASQGNKEFADRAKKRGRLYERKLRSFGKSRRRRKPTCKVGGGPQPHTIFRGRIVDALGMDSAEDDGNLQNYRCSSTESSQNPPLDITTPTPPPLPSTVRTEQELNPQPNSSGEPQTLKIIKAIQPESESISKAESERPNQKSLDNNLDLVEFLETGGTLSQVQARTAFATYLLRVKNRLMIEDSSQENQAETEDTSEQMDLVLRFLKRAAGNLQHPFRVVVPSRKLPLSDRRRILAKQLGDFVRLYGRETDQLRSSRPLDKISADINMVNEEKLAHILATASERELEEILTVYTKVHKSASIFIGGSTAVDSANLEPSTMSNPAPGYRVNGSGDRIESRARVPIPRPPPVPAPVVPAIPKPDSFPEEDFYIPPAAMTRKIHSSYTSAVSIYSGRVGTSLMRRRPVSAFSSKPAPMALIENDRIRSAGSRRPMASVIQQPDLLITNQDKSNQPIIGHDDSDTGSDDVMTDALQRLSVRQQARQYLSGAQTSNILTRNKHKDRRTDVVGGPPLRVTRHRHAIIHDDQSIQTDSIFEEDIKTYNSYNLNRNTPSQGLGVNFHLNELAKRFTGPRGRSLGALPRHELRRQNSLKDTETMMKELRILEESKVLLEQSKAKHQDMVARAHAANHCSRPPYNQQLLHH